MRQVKNNTPRKALVLHADTEMLLWLAASDPAVA